jgi:hypothetical protein
LFSKKIRILFFKKINKENKFSKIKKIKKIKETKSNSKNLFNIIKHMEINGKLLANIFLGRKIYNF